MGRRPAGDAPPSRGATALTAFIDTNVLIRHLTGDPPEMAARATAALASDERWLLADLVLAECVYVLESFYEVGRDRVAELMRATLAHPTIETVDPLLLLRALEVYELDHLDFADAYLVAQAEATGVGESSRSTGTSTGSRASTAASPERAAKPGGFAGAGGEASTYRRRPWAATRPPARGASP